MPGTVKLGTEGVVNRCVTACLVVEVVAKSLNMSVVVSVDEEATGAAVVIVAGYSVTENGSTVEPVVSSPFLPLHAAKTVIISVSKQITVIYCLILLFTVITSGRINFYNYIL
jgi:hypothetical protein